MRKFITVALTLLACFLSGCAKSPPAIVLEFDGQSAYFTGAVKLLPIEGEEPSAGEADITESAVVKLKSNVAVLLRLTLNYRDGAAQIDGLKVKTARGIERVRDGMVLYESAQKVKSADVELTFFLSSDTPITEEGKTLQFLFSLLAREEGS